MVACGREPVTSRYAAYQWHHDHQRHGEKGYFDPEPAMLFEAETLAEILTWVQSNYRHLRRHSKAYSFVEIFDWNDGSTTWVTRVG